MVETITPVVYGGNRRKWAGAVGIHTLGAALAAAAFGWALGAAGAVAGAPWAGAGAVLVAVLAGAYALRELAGVPLPIPQRRRQVPEWWRTFFSRRVSAFLYGLGLGVGFLTFLRYGTLVAVAGAALASGDPVTGAVMVAPFGIARGLSVAVAGGAPGRIVDRLESLAMSAIPRRANGVALVAVAAGAAWAMASDGAGDPARPGVVLLAAVFGVAAMAKVVRGGDWREGLAAYVPAGAAGPVAVAVPVAEAAVPILVVAGRAGAAAGLAAVLLVAFSVAIARAHVSGTDRLPCGCFGKTTVRDYRVLLGRNAALLLVAALVLADPPVVSPAGIRFPGPGEVVPAALAVAGVLLGVWAAIRTLAWLRTGRGPA